MAAYKVGDHIIYHKQKASTSPGPRAKQVEPSQHGEDYWYFVDKFWTVAKVNGDETIEVVTRRGKRHTLKTTDPRMRKSNLIDEFLHRTRFPDLASLKDQQSAE